MAAETKLLPCPFCGSDEIDIEREGTNRVSCIMRCLNCGCYMESNETGHGEAWNRRPETKDNLQTSNNIRMDDITLDDLEKYAISFAATTLCTVCDSRHAVTQFIKFLGEQRRHA